MAYREATYRMAELAMQIAALLQLRRKREAQFI